MKKLLVAVLLAGGCGCCYAAPVSPDEALQRALGEGPAYVAGRLPKFTLAYTEKINDADAVYVFGHKDGAGFIVTPADDCAPAVLGYGDSKIHDKNGEMAPGFQYWINALGRQVSYSATHSRGQVIRKARAEREPIAPLCKTIWNQDDPFNLKCPPKDPPHCVTGCVATAMAQVLKYHNWPETGEGYVSYYYDSKTILRMNYAATTFKWDDMLDSYYGNYSEASSDAVSTLMIACGYSVKMNYRTSSSGAYSFDIGSALGSYFKYDKSLRFLVRDYYALQEWEDIIYTSLKEDGPVIYNGQSSIGGHSFVCDGYQDDGYFHFNWGWGGISDGYFLLDALDPEHQGIGGSDSGFDYIQDIIVGIRPDRTGDSQWTESIMYGNGLNELNWLADERELMIETPVYNAGPYMIDNLQIGFKFTDIQNPDENPIYIIESLDEPLPVNYGFQYLGFELSDIPDGTYEVDLVYHAGEIEDESEMKTVLFPIYSRCRNIITISGEDVSLDILMPEVPDFVDGEFPSSIENATKPVRVTGRLENPNDYPYLCFTSVVIIDRSLSSILAYSMPAPYDMEANASTDVDLEANVMGLNRLPSGSYYIAVAELVPTNNSVTLLCDPQAVNISNQSGVTNIFGDTDSDGLEIFTADGIRVAGTADGKTAPQLPAGLYIMRKGSKTEKILVK